MKPILTALSIAFLSLSTAAWASDEVWYVVPEDKGDCGDECYRAPTAWIDEAGGNYALGVTCENTMILGGKATYVNEITIESLEMVVDNSSLGQFAVETGLNDVFIQPQDAHSQNPSAIVGTLSAGQEVVLRFRDGQSYKFTLAGARGAVGLMRELCARS